MKNMLKYQELDNEIVRLETELKQNAEYKNAVKMQQVYKDCQTKVAELNEKSKALIAEFEQYQKIFNQMVENLEVVSRNVEKKDEKKIDGLIEAGEAITNNLMRLEKKIAMVSQECVNVRNEYTKIKNSAIQAKTSGQKSKESYAAIKADTEKKVAEIKKELDALEKSVDKQLLAKYKQKRTEKSVVFVEDRNGVCGGCRMAISAVKKAKLKADGMIECESCGRIIYTK